MTPNVPKSSKLRKFWLWLNRSPRRTFALRLAAITLAVSLFSFARLLNVVGIDDWLERVQLDQMDYSVNVAVPSALRLIYIKGDDLLDKAKDDFQSRQQPWRREHARLLRAFANAPRLVAFDFIFPKPDSDADSQEATANFGNAIRDAKVRVLVGAELNDDGVPGLIAALKSADSALTSVGGLRLEQGARSKLVRRYVLAESQAAAGLFNGRQPAIPSLALMMRLAELAPSRTARTSVQLDQSKGQLILLSSGKELERISCDIEKELVAQSPRWLATIPFHYRREGFPRGDHYTDVLRRLPDVAADYKNKIVLVGAQIDKDISEDGEKIRLAPDPDNRFAYGYQVHASVFSDLSAGTYPRRLPWMLQVVVLLVLAAVSALGRAKLPSTEFEVDTKIAGKRKVPLGLLILLGVYIAVVWVFYRSAFILFDVGYGALAVVGAYFLCGNVFAPPPTIVKEGS